MTQVEFDLPNRTLMRLDWQEGDLVQHSGSTWKIKSIVADRDGMTQWVTMEKILA